MATWSPNWSSMPWRGRTAPIIATRMKRRRKPESAIRAANPVPELFSDRLEEGEKKRRYVPDEIPEEPAEKDESEESFMGRMTDWFQR